MKVEIIGTLKEVQEVITFDSGFQKQTVILETEDKYDNLIPLQVIKDQCGTFDAIAIGTRIKVNAYLGGREWNGKHFLDLKFAELAGVQRDLNKEPAPPARFPLLIVTVVSSKSGTTLLVASALTFTSPAFVAVAFSTPTGAPAEKFITRLMVKVHSPAPVLVAVVDPK